MLARARGLTGAAGSGQVVGGTFYAVAHQPLQLACHRRDRRFGTGCDLDTTTLFLSSNATRRPGSLACRSLRHLDRVARGRVAIDEEGVVAGNVAGGCPRGR